jgi:hypothetical protein
VISRVSPVEKQVKIVVMDYSGTEGLSADVCLAHELLLALLHTLIAALLSSRESLEQPHLTLNP